MRNPLSLTVEDIAEIVSALEDRGVAMQISLVPIKKDNEESNSTEKGGAE